MISVSLITALAIDTLSIIFLGDIMQHKEQIKSAHIEGRDTLVSESYEYSDYFKHVGKYIDAADFAVANMEFALANGPFTGYPSFSAPTTLAEETKESGVDLFLCANNHICDKGKRGLKASFENYDKVGVPITGAYRDSTEKYHNYPYITDIKGVRVAFINFTYGTNGIRVPSPYLVNKLDKEDVAAAFSRARERGAQIIIALPHWGDEYVLKPNKEQKEWEKYLYELGADAIIGSHPHVIQPLEIKDKDSLSKQITLFSLGNFISNMSKTNTPMGLMLSLRIIVPENSDPYIDSCTPIPIWCSRMGRFEKGYTVLPVEEYLNKKELFLNQSDYQKMVETYNRLKYLFQNGE